MSKGLDANGDLRMYANKLAGLGYSFVCRYINPGKLQPLTVTESQALSDVGLYIISIWEEGSPIHPGYFNADRGGADGSGSVSAAQYLGQPVGTPIYFAVDYDAASEDLPAIASYFSAVHSRVKAAGYAVGVYGSGLVCQDLSQIGWVSKTWLSQSRGFAGYDEWKDQADILQGVETQVLGLDVDLDTANGDAGGWQSA